MGQLTERLVREILRYADRDEHPPMTASEVRQLCYSWLQANGKSTHADRPALETCEQCFGVRYVGDVPCSACNAMGESSRANRRPEHG
jgi:hypothetical protein